MPSISLALELASLIGPKIVGLFAGEKGEDIATQVVELGKAVSGESDPEHAVRVIKSNPDLAAEFQKQLQQREEKLLTMAYQDRANARDMYRDSDSKVADEISQKIMNVNVWVVLILIGINAAAVYFLKEEAAVLATVSNILGIVIKSLLDERKEVCGFYLGGSLDGRVAASSQAKGMGPSSR